MNAYIIEKAKKIKLMLLDVDGVMTDGTIYLSSDGQEMKAFNIYDGHGIFLLHTAQIRVGIISGRISPVVSARAEELRITEVHQGVLNKTQVYEEILKKYDLSDEEVAYIGDDLIDLPLMQRVGLSFAVANAVKEAKEAAHVQLERRGGDGAVREAVEILLRAQDKWKP